MDSNATKIGPTNGTLKVTVSRKKKPEALSMEATQPKSDDVNINGH